MILLFPGLVMLLVMLGLVAGARRTNRRQKCLASIATLERELLPEWFPPKQNAISGFDTQLWSHATMASPRLHLTNLANHSRVLAKREWLDDTSQGQYQ